MSTHQINFLERELIKLSDEINSNAGNENELKKQQLSIRNELATLRIKEFEEREYLDFDDDYR